MKINSEIRCELFPCEDVDHTRHNLPGLDVDLERVRIVMISEAPAAKIEDNYYMDGDPLYHQTTVLAFKDAGIPVTSFQDILDQGVYLTNAVKCAKLNYGLKSATIIECSYILGRELALFPNVAVILLMGDSAIRSLNETSRRAGLGRVIPAGSTYKIRGADFQYRGIPVLPSYLHAGPSFFIEKSKRKMIAEDIARAYRIAGNMIAQ